MNREDLAELLKKYLDGRCTDAERASIEQWYSQSGLSETYTAIHPGMEEVLWRQIQDRITIEPVVEPIHTRKAQFGRTTMWWLTAVAAMLLATFFFFVKSERNDSQVTAHLQEKINTGKVIKTVKLSDGSTVSLKPGAGLKYPLTFGDDIREVYLSGEGFFDVTKNPAKPFIVYSGDVATKVVGTSFIIRPVASGKSDVEVSVITGKVIVEKKDAKKEHANNGVILTPNHKVTYYAADSHFVTSVVDQPNIIQLPKEMPRQKFFRFDGTPLHAVLEKMEFAYGIEFELINENIANCPVTADLTEQPMYTRLDLISASLNAKYELKGTSIVLSGGSCE